MSSAKDFLARALEGTLPKERVTIEDCLLVLAVELGRAYFAGDCPLGVELRHLVDAARNNPKDPMLDGLDRIERTELRVALRLLNHERQRRDNRAKQEAPPETTGEK